MTGWKVLSKCESPSPSSCGRNLGFYGFVRSMSMIHTSLVQHFLNFCQLITSLEKSSLYQQSRLPWQGLTQTGRAQHSSGFLLEIWSKKGQEVKEAECHEENRQCLVTGNGKTREGTDAEIPQAAPRWMGRDSCVPTRHSVLFQDRPVRRKQLKQIRQYVRRCKWIWLLQGGKSCHPGSHH